MTENTRQRPGTARPLFLAKRLAKGRDLTSVHLEKFKLTRGRNDPKKPARYP